jgi:hypothetical protein
VLLGMLAIFVPLLATVTVTIILGWIFRHHGIIYFPAQLPGVRAARGHQYGLRRRGACGDSFTCPLGRWATVKCVAANALPNIILDDEPHIER